MRKICAIGVFLLCNASGVSSVLADEHAPSWLFVQTAATYEFDGTILSLPYYRQIFGFTDRPNRLHTYLSGSDFVSLWTDEEGGFGDEPPNAVLTWLEEGSVNEAEIIIRGAALDPSGQNILYQLETEVGFEISREGGYVSLFIDPITGWVGLPSCTDDGFILLPC
jgi:hypothetical protein